LTNSDSANPDRQEITLLLRRIRDEFWDWAIRQSTDVLMGRVARYGKADRELIRKAIVADLDQGALRHVSNVPIGEHELGSVLAVGRK
jgi:hypothetical protein